MEDSAAAAATGAAVAVAAESSADHGHPYRIVVLHSDDNVALCLPVPALVLKGTA